MIGISRCIGVMEPSADAGADLLLTSGFPSVPLFPARVSPGLRPLLHTTPAASQHLPPTRTLIHARTCTAAMRLVPALPSSSPVRSTVALPMSSSLYLSLSRSSSCRAVAPWGTWGVWRVHGAIMGWGGWGPGAIQAMQVVGLVGRAPHVGTCARAPRGLLHGSTPGSTGASCRARVCYAHSQRESILHSTHPCVPET